MTFPWFPLFLNILLLVASIFICNILNAGRPAPVWNGPLLFIGFSILAMALDLALTIVFASATTTDRDRYIDLSSLMAWSERAIAYAIPCAIAAFLALRARSRKPRQAQPVVIQTSEYTQSELPT
jgi:membrane protease YdiL (CAAX protease family)